MPNAKQPLRHRGSIIRLLLALVFVGAALGACGGDGPGPIGPTGPTDSSDDDVVGSGVIIVEARVVEGFDRILLAGEGAVIVTSGAQEEFTLETDDNIIELIETRIRDRVLEIRTVEGVDIEPSDSVVYRVGAKALDSIALAGVGSVDITEWAVATPEVVLSGVGDIRVGGLDADSLIVDLTGVGSVTIAGTTTKQSVSMTGVGDYDASDLMSDHTSIVVTGVGSATVWATNTLELTASGPSSVEYYGAPVVTEQVDRLAAVRSLGER